jgi:hypothetical protein
MEEQFTDLGKARRSLREPQEEEPAKVENAF